MEEPETGVEAPETDVVKEEPSTSEEPVDAAGRQEEPTEEIQGLIKARQAEATKRQSVEQERDYLRSELSRMNQPYEEEIPQDEYLTKGQIDKQFTDRQVHIDTQQRHLANQNSLLAARGAHEDFDKAYEFADKLCKDKPYMVNVLLASENVGEAIYEYGRTHGDYSKGEVEKAVKKIQKNLSRAPTLTDVGGRSSADLDKANFFMNRSKEEHDADVKKRLGFD